MNEPFLSSKSHLAETGSRESFSDISVAFGMMSLHAKFPLFWRNLDDIKKFIPEFVPGKKSEFRSILERTELDIAPVEKN